MLELNSIQKKYIDDKLEKLSKNKFRSSFHLRKYMIEYIDSKGIDVIYNHCIDLIEKNLVSAQTSKDGKQTPMKAHPVFVAQHATATCCRNCLYKWYHIPKDRELNEKEKRFITSLIMEWIKIEYKKR